MCWHMCVCVRHHSATMVSLWGHYGTPRGHSGTLGGHLELLWNTFVSVWRHTGATLGYLGVTLVHFGVKALSQGRQWLVFMYVGLVVSGPVIGGLLVGLGIADSILNLRLRLTANKNRDQ